MVTGVLIDWGGVLTTSLADSIEEWIVADRIDGSVYRQVMKDMIRHAYEGSLEGENAIHALERGELPAIDFERELAARLLTVDGVPPLAEGLLTRMFAGFRPVESMYGMLRRARAAGLRTCLLSNSWDNAYPRDGWIEIFDEIVISGEVGMRKPEPRIFHHALGLLGMAATQCVFIDDIEANVTAAEAIGIHGLHHTDPAETIIRLEGLTGHVLREEFSR